MQIIGLISDELVYKPAIVAIATIAFKRTKIRTKKNHLWLQISSHLTKKLTIYNPIRFGRGQNLVTGPTPCQSDLITIRKDMFC